VNILGPSVNRRLLAVLVLLVSLAGCNATPFAPVASEDDWVRTQLFFGLTNPRGGAVSESEWKAFLDTSVTPRFPAGFTVVQAIGHYRDHDHAHYEEPSRVLIVFHRRAAVEADHTLDQIAREYVKRFDQECVLRTDSPARVAFITRPSPAATRTTAPRP
jgi:hypothetical protein